MSLEGAGAMTAAEAGSARLEIAVLTQSVDEEPEHDGIKREWLLEFWPVTLPSVGESPRRARKALVADAFLERLGRPAIGVEGVV
jgi:hypothetical protein